MLKVIENNLYKKLLMNYKIDDEIFIDEFLSIVDLDIIIKKVCSEENVYILNDYDNYNINCNDLSYEEYSINKIKLTCGTNKKSLITLSEKIFEFYYINLQKINKKFVIVVGIDIGIYGGVFITFYKYRGTDIIEIDSINNYEQPIKVGYINF